MRVGPWTRTDIDVNPPGGSPAAADARAGPAARLPTARPPTARPPAAEAADPAAEAPDPGADPNGAYGQPDPADGETAWIAAAWERTAWDHDEDEDNAPVTAPTGSVGPDYRDIADLPSDPAPERLVSDPDAAEILDGWPAWSDLPLAEWPATPLAWPEDPAAWPGDPAAQPGPLPAGQLEAWSDAERGPADEAPPAVDPVELSWPAGTSRATKRSTVFVVVAVAVAALVALAVVAVMLISRSGRFVEPTAPGAGGGAGAAAPIRPAHAVSAPLNGLTDAGFELLTGATTVTVRSTGIDNDLFRAATPETSSLVPRAVVGGDGRVQLDLVDLHDGDGPSAAEVLLNSRVKWRVRMLGGAASSTVDLRAADLTGVEFVGGASRIEAWLPRPDGVGLTRMTGGAKDMVVHVPLQVPVRVRVGSGASTVTVDGVTRSGVAPGTVMAPANWERAPARIDIDAAAGVSSVTVDRY